MASKEEAFRSPGVFTISLDFELYWGVRDKVDLDAYGPNILGARDAIPRILDLFGRHGVRATWATVGFLFFEEKDELLAHLPSRRPSYTNASLSPYDDVIYIGPNERRDPYHFGRALIRNICQYPGQEIGTHTFSHYYCVEPGQTLDEFQADLEAAHSAAQLLGIQLKSMVFPRNQWRADYLPACAVYGIRAVRGNPTPRMYKPGASNRILRLADAYVNLSGHQCHRPSIGRYLTDVPASRLLRPFSPVLAPVEPLRLRRIRTGMKHAAEHGLVYHLWWHPHNFGSHQEENFAVLRKVLGYFNEFAEEYGMVSRTMGDLCETSVSD